MHAPRKICAAVIVALLAMGCSLAAPGGSDRGAAADDPLPRRVAQALDRLDGAELVSLEPWAAAEAPGDRLNGYVVLGSTRLSKNDARAAGAAITSAAVSSDNIVAACFDPRHALRFQSSGHAYVILACYDCGSLRVFEDGRQIGGAGLTGSAAGLNKMLAAGRVSISRSADELAAERARAQDTNYAQPPAT